MGRRDWFRRMFEVVGGIALATVATLPGIGRAATCGPGPEWVRGCPGGIDRSTLPSRA